ASQKNRIRAFQRLQHVGGVHLAVLQEVVTAPVVRFVAGLEAKLLRRRVEDLEGFTGHFRANAVARDVRNIIVLHVRSPGGKSDEAHYLTKSPHGEEKRDATTPRRW